MAIVDYDVLLTDILCKYMYTSLTIGVDRVDKYVKYE